MGRRTKLRLGRPFPSPRTRLRTPRHNPRHLPLPRLRLPHDRQPLQTTPSKFITASRVHSDKQVRQIAQSIESFGFNVPLLIDDEQKVIAGHGRLLAARRLGWDTVPAIRLSHLTESQRMAFLIADNRLTENSSWDERMLGEQLKI